MRLFLLAALALPGLCVNCSGIEAISPRCSSTEWAHTRDTFYVGGHYQQIDNTSANIISDQLYVEKLTPAAGVEQKHPLIFISAGLPSGSLWLNTPDNRRGWASYFLSKGYQVYVVDVIGTGRSTQEDLDRFPLRVGATDVTVEAGFTAPELFNTYPQSQNHTQWPGNGTKGDPIFDAFMAAFIPLTSNSSAQELAMRAAGCRLLYLIGESYLISHSGGGSYSILMSDECPQLVRGNINIEPGNVPFASPFAGDARPFGLTRTPITYDPPISSASDLRVVEVGQDAPDKHSCFLQDPNATVHTLPDIAKVPYVMLTGSASVHITYDHCFLAFLTQAGVPSVEWIKLGDIGIEGNGHFMMVEKNNIEIAGVVNRWIQKNET